MVFLSINMNKLLDYFKGDDLAANVWKSKYALEGEETPDDMHWRMAKEFARKDKEVRVRDSYDVELSDYGKERDQFTEKNIFDLFKGFEFIVPQGSVMSMLGNTNIGSLSNCFQGDVKVLTRSGWKKISDLEGLDVEIMTKGGQWVIAPFKSYGNQHLDKVTISNGHQTKEIYATSKHRWALYKKSKPETIAKIKTTSELKEGDVLYATYGKFRNYKPSAVGIAHGITFGDGHTVKGNDNANNISLCAFSRELGKYFPESYVSTDENLCEGGADFYGGLPNYFRELPNILENKAYLYGWLAGYFAADGHIDERGAVMINSSRKENILFVQDVCGVLGIGCTDITEQTVISNLTNQPHTMYKCFIHKNHLSDNFFLLKAHKSRFKQTHKAPSRWKIVKVQSTKRMEEVFCAEVPETESFVIEGNILSMNCFVVGQPNDSYGSILYKEQEQIQLMKRRGGVGLDLSLLAPKGRPVKNAAKTSTGAVSFAERYSNGTREVAQDGRRGALMISMDIRHPDSMDFIKIKRDLTKVTGANMSVKLGTDFIGSVRKDMSYVLTFPHNYDRNLLVDMDLSNLEYDKLYDINKDINADLPPGYIKIVQAKEHWDEIIKSAHSVAEPGIIFEDNHIDYSPDGVYDQYRGVTTNPCGEIFMQPYDACRLIINNLFGYVSKPFTEEAKFDFDKFYRYNYEAMRLADIIIDLELEYIDRILDKIDSDPETDEEKRIERILWERVSKTAASSRRAGLGFTALGDTIAALGMKYDSDEALEFIRAMMRTKMESELDCTIDLAKMRGPFTGWVRYKEYDGDGVHTNKFYGMLAKEFPKQVKDMLRYGRRNVSWSTLAPGGTTSLMTQTTSGIEPLFQPFYTRRKKINPNEEGVRVDFVDDNGDTWQEFPVLHPKFKDWINYTYGAEIITAEGGMGKEELQDWFEKSPWYGSTANDIDWIRRVEVQGLIQEYITHSISSTINLPSDVTEKEVSDIYMAAWEKGLKGITVYRDGSRSGVLVSNDKPEEITTFHDNHAPRRPKRMTAKLLRFNNNKEKWIAFVGLLDGKPYEIFTGLLDDIKIPHKIEVGEIVKKKDEDGKKSYVFEYEGGEEEIGTVFNKDFWNYGKLVSGVLRHGMPIQYVVELISQLKFVEDHINTWKNGVVRALKKFIPDGEAKGAKCEDCGGTNIVFEEGCLSCKDCGSSKCG